MRVHVRVLISVPQSSAGVGLAPRPGPALLADTEVCHLESQACPSGFDDMEGALGARSGLSV